MADTYGRRRLFTDAQYEEALRKARGVQVLAAQLLEKASGLPCSRRLVNQAVKRSKRLRQVIEDTVEGNIDIAELKAYKAIDSDDGPMIRWYLERKGKHRGYAPRYEQQNLGADGQPADPQQAFQVIVYLPDNGRDPDLIKPMADPRVKIIEHAKNV